MNTIIKSREAASVVTTGFWFALALLASGIGWPPSAAAQDAAWQDQPRRRARTVAQNYPDAEPRNRSVAMNDDEPTLTPPVPRGAVESPSNQPMTRAKAQPAGDAAPNDDNAPARRTNPKP